MVSGKCNGGSCVQVRSRDYLGLGILEVGISEGERGGEFYYYDNILAVFKGHVNNIRKFLHNIVRQLSHPYLAGIIITSSAENTFIG